MRRVTSAARPTPLASQIRISTFWRAIHVACCHGTNGNGTRTKRTGWETGSACSARNARIAINTGRADPPGHYQSRDTYTQMEQTTLTLDQEIDAVLGERISDQARTDVRQPEALAPMDMTDGDIRYSETTREEWSVKLGYDRSLLIRTEVTTS